MTAKEHLVKAIVQIKRSWLKTTGKTSTEIFESADQGLDSDVLVILANSCNIGTDPYFAEVVFKAPALKDQSVEYVKALIPKMEIALVIELKAPEGISALGYKNKN